MITKTYIVPGLQDLDSAYKKAASTAEAERFAKLAVIELCGWIEETMKSVILRCARRHLKDPKNREYCEQEVVRKTHGFDYNKHFREMLLRTIGLIAVERLEKQVNQSKHDAMKSNLGSLKKVRDGVAHTHLKGVAVRLEAPSITINRFKSVYEGLDQIDKAMRRNGW